MKKFIYEQKKLQSFKTSLERGQTQPASLLKNTVDVDLIHHGQKYKGFGIIQQNYNLFLIVYD